ncbi:MAG: hypothetical protein M3R59_09815 [Verrucomicrobiota bacterium]|nr:hypothetical protein [Verrucomicrobiota bacterium]MDQ2918808.1 hypothetical protein [Verrucomicrobiota bacterium]
MSDSTLTAEFNRWQMRALVIGLIAAALSLFGAFINRAQFFHSYLFAWLFWIGLSLGALVIVMMQFLTGGMWGVAVRRLSEAAFMTLPMMALLFLPVLFGIRQIYGWSLPNGLPAVGARHKHQYLTIPLFTARSVLYFAVLIIIALLLRRWSATQDESDAASRRVSALSAGGLVAYILCMNFASTDWVMSLDPQWYSTVFVVVFAAGQFLAALALMTALLSTFSSHFSLADAIPIKAFHDLGNMLLTFVVFWIYVSFSQFLIIWSGNLPREISWYLERSRGGWQWLALALMVFQFLLPFALLLSREAKRKKERLAVIAICIVGANILNDFWLVAPSFHPRVYVHWLDFAEFIALGGFWFAMFFSFLKQRPFLPLHSTERLLDG